MGVEGCGADKKTLSLGVSFAPVSGVGLVAQPLNATEKAKMIFNVHFIRNCQIAGGLTWRSPALRGFIAQRPVE